MPLPAKLKHRVEFTPDLLREVALELQVRGTVCELPDCSKQAVYPYRNDRSVMFICEDDKTRFDLVPANQRTLFDKRLSEVMYRGMLKKSFVFMNNESGFALEKMVAEFQRQVADLDKSAASTEKRKRAEIRRHLRESQTVIGMPDEALITSRERNDLRRRRGETVLGPNLKDHTVESVPTEHLVRNLPRVVDPAAEASLPFPVPNLM